MAGSYAEPIFDTLGQVIYPVLLSLGLAVPRCLGVILVTPAFNRLGLNGTIRVAVGVVLALPVLPLTLTLYQTTHFTTLMVGGLVIKELVIGVLIGLAFGVPFWAAEVAGALIDLQRGASMGHLLDPNQTEQNSLTATLLTITMIALFFAAGGFQILLDGLYRSYGLWPIIDFSPVVDQQTAMSMLGILDRIMSLGVRMMAPLIVAVLAGDIVLAYLARIAPNLHVFSLSLPIKNLLFTTLMVFYIVFLLPRMTADIASLHDVLAGLKQTPGS